VSAIRGRDDGDLKKYRTEIPNVVFTLGLDPYALSLYCHLKRTTGAADGGLCYKSTRTLADETGMSAGKVSEARAELEKPRDELGGKALIAVERPKDQSKTVNVVCEDIWPENFGAFTTRTRERSPHERKKEPVVEEGVEANASSGKPQASPVALEKYIVDRIYEAMREAGFRLPNEHFTYQLGRAKDVLQKDKPTDEEIEGLPAAFVGLWTVKGKADVHSALMELRRQRARPEYLSGRTEPSYYERRTAAKDKPKPLPVYMAFYPDAVESSVRDWIAQGLTDTEITARLEGEAAA